MKPNRYTLVRAYHEKVETPFGYKTKLQTEDIPCKTLKEAIELGSCLSDEEKVLGSYIFDNVNHEKLTLKGER